MQKHTNYEVGIYCRLSRDDNNGNQESMSITNQRQVLSEYVQERGWNLKEVYIDDGISGTVFSRPSLQRMLADAEAGRINCIVTKDLSRFGRNYVQTGYYTEEFFPERDIRFIAINDGIDTFEDHNGIAPFQNILNEWYPKEVSKKVRQVKKTGARQGKFMNSKAPYGYVKDPADKHKLIKDEEAAQVIDRIFRLYAGGCSARSIAEELNLEQIKSPRAYYYSKAGRSNPNPGESMTWCSNTVSQLLKNRAYIGDMIHGKRQMVSFKSKKRRTTDPSEWIVVEGTHEPLVDRETWDVVQKRVNSSTKVRKNSLKEVGMFSGLIRCADCGSVLTFGARWYKSKVIRQYKCSRYSNHGKSVCSVHYITEDALCDIVLDDIRRYVKLTEADEDAVINNVLSTLNAGHGRELSACKEQLRDTERRLGVVLESVRKLFEEKVAGSVPDGLFRSLMDGYEKERLELEGKASQLKKEADSLERSASDVSKWLDRIRKYMAIETLDRETVHDLIESITVSERYKVDGENHQDVHIRYRFIGSLDTQNIKQSRTQPAVTGNALDCAQFSQVV